MHIGDIISRAIEESGCADAFMSQHICYLWPEAVGATLNRYTTARWVSRDELHVVIAGGPAKSEITFMADAIVRRLNELAGTADNPVVRRLIVH